MLHIAIPTIIIWLLLPIPREVTLSMRPQSQEEAETQVAQSHHAFSNDDHTDGIES